MSDLSPIQVLQLEVDALRVTLVTLIIWMSGSANSPLRHDECRRLIDMIEKRVKS